MLRHLISVDYCANRERDLGLTAQRVAFTHHPRADAQKIALGGAEQVLPFACTLYRELGVAADQQTLTGKVRCRDRGQVALIEQRKWQMPFSEQRLDGRCPQGGDPIQTGGAEIFGDARLGDPATIANQNHVVELEALLEFRDLFGHCHGIGGVAFKDFDGDRATIRRAEQTIVRMHANA
jgi:hypothetical protein